MGSPGETPERLDSWKSIADYLDRDVATVRRWEKSLGLPIRRVPGGRGRSVFAFKNEIDEWLKRTPDDTEASALVTAEATRGHWRWVLAGALIAVVAAGGVWIASAWRGEPDPLAIEVTPTGIVGRAEDGVERWRFPFASDAKAFVDTSRSDNAVVPFAGENPGYVAGVMYSIAVADESPRGGELFWLGRDGSLQRRFAFNDRLEFGAGAYEGPWVLADFRLHPQDGPSRIAVVSHHLHWWPSVVSVLDARWQRTQTFVNSGWIDRVVWLPADRLLIGGFNNAHDGAMVAVLDSRAMQGHSPSTGNRDFECTGCGSATPIRYIVMPRSEVNRVTASPPNRGILETTRNKVVMRTIEEPRATGQAAEGIYEFTPQIELVSATYGDRYWDSHRALELAGKLDHPRERCPEKDGPPFIHVWTPAQGWKRTPR